MMYFATIIIPSVFSHILEAFCASGMGRVQNNFLFFIPVFKRFGAAVIVISY